MIRYCVITVLCAVLFVPTAMGQVASVFSEAPSRMYYHMTLPSFYRGNFNETLAFHNNDLRNAV
jgi:hypothetical protein